MCNTVRGGVSNDIIPFFLHYPLLQYRFTYMNTNDMTEKQKLFCQYYLGDANFNASEAAIRAGYSKATARQIGSENLTKPYIQSYLSDLTRRAEEKAEINIAEIVKHLHDMAFFDVKDMFDQETGALKPMKDWPEIASKIVAGFEVQEIISDGEVVGYVKKVKLPSRERNTENLGRYLAMFTDKIKDVSDPTEMIHYYIPRFDEEDKGD